MLLLRSVSAIDNSEVMDIVFGLHVFIELILSIQSFVDSLAVKFLKLLAANGARALRSPFSRITIGSHGYIHIFLQS
jgi:hypothetical protein